MLTKELRPDRGTVHVTFDLPDVGGRVVHIVGEFTGWQGLPLERQLDGSWRIAMDLPPGREYQFRYLIDGERWENDWEADRYTPSPFGHDNSVVITPAITAAEKVAAADRSHATQPPQADRTSIAGRKTPARATTSAREEEEEEEIEKETPKAKRGAGARTVTQKTAARTGTAKRGAAKTKSAGKTAKAKSDGEKRSAKPETDRPKRGR